MVLGFWERVELLIPAPAPRSSQHNYVRKPGGGRKPKDARLVFEGIVYVLRHRVSVEGVAVRAF